jgi:hypothetical protein
MFSNKTEYATDFTVMIYDLYAVEPGYNDIGLCEISSTASHKLW